MRNPLALLVLCVWTGIGAAQTVEPPAAPAKGQDVDDFGFWAGEWLVVNARRDFDRESFVDAGPARATIEPLLGGDALLERWEGESASIASTFGLSLRYFDEDRGRWVVLLNWPGGSPRAAQFTRMEGRFEDGMIALHPPRVFAGSFEQMQYLSSRFVFSDVTDDTCRWQMQLPGGSTEWITTWSMEFVRQAEAATGPMRIDAVPEDCACESENARLTDWMVGAWSGETDDAAVGLRVSSAIRGCGVVAELRVDRGGDNLESVVLLAWDEKTASWQARELGLIRPLRSHVWQSVGIVSDQAISLRSMSPDDMSGMVFHRLDGGGMQFGLTLPDGERLEVELSRP